MWEFLYHILALYSLYYISNARLILSMIRYSGISTKIDTKILLNDFRVHSSMIVFIPLLVMLCVIQPIFFPTTFNFRTIFPDVLVLSSSCICFSLFFSSHTSKTIYLHWLVNLFVKRFYHFTCLLCFI